MGVFKKLVIIVSAIIIIFVLVGFALPSAYKVERSIVINAPASKIYQHIVDLKAWQQWGVWYQRDPDMQITYSGSTAQIGMTSTWLSATQGNGEMQIIGLEDDHRLIYSLTFTDMGMTSTGEFVLTPQDNATLVTWMDYGDVGINPINHYFVLFMDRFIGPDFEMGLENLKMVVEG
ncbi:MAG: SRPBCC family protein [Paraglaciecola sp.]|nr:SRPBCC family protein [Paraglaciecola sp.]NCT49044.1 SRPBCC family protein [Paraglaciecola sp.]